MLRRPPRSKRTATLSPYTTRFPAGDEAGNGSDQQVRQCQAEAQRGEDEEDLDGAARERKAHRGAEERRRAGRRQEGRQDAGGKAAAQAMRWAVRLALSTSDGREATPEDRQSGVSGKSVAVRVDPGGRRISKKKQKVH